MPELLFLKSSPRGDESSSNRFAEMFVDKWLSANPQAIVNRRDVGPGNVVGPTQDWVTANLTPSAERTEEQRQLLAESDMYIAELHRATHVLIATPMYNFTVPWNLKAYIDNIVREEETFFFSPEKGYGSLVKPGKKLLLMWTATGDYSPGSPFAQYDLLTPTIATAFGFIGVTDFSVISCGSRGEAPELAAAALRRCHDGIHKLSPVW
jgi:FMN-dependent NADH-azoreductase